MDATPLGVTVSLRAADARAVQDAFADADVLPLSKAALGATIIGGVATAGLAALAAKLGGPEMSWWSWAAFGWPGAVAFAWAGARRLETAATAWPADDPRGASRELSIDAEGLLTRGADFETRIRWSGVAEIRETPEHLLFVTPWKEVYCAPRRCFADAAAATAFAAKARALRDVAKSAAPTTSA
ncbi:MAG: YcxB family protein [Rhizobiales bacterium]|nr:YcxB family protein [Hyphomicrobiales bacterium]